MSILGTVDTDGMEEIPAYQHFAGAFDYENYNIRNQAKIDATLTQQASREKRMKAMFDEISVTFVPDAEPISKLNVAWIDIDNRQILYEAGHNFAFIYVLVVAIQDGYSTGIPKRYKEVLKIEAFKQLIKHTNELAEQVATQVTRLFRIYKGAKVDVDHAAFDAMLQITWGAMETFLKYDNLKTFLESEAYKLVRLVSCLALALASPASHLQRYLQSIADAKLIKFPVPDEDYDGSSDYFATSTIVDPTLPRLIYFRKVVLYDDSQIVGMFRYMHKGEVELDEFTIRIPDWSQKSNEKMMKLFEIVFAYPLIARESIINKILAIVSDTGLDETVVALQDEWMTVSSVMHLHSLSIIQNQVKMIDEYTIADKRMNAYTTTRRVLRSLQHDITQPVTRNAFYTELGNNREEADKLEAEYNKMKSKGKTREQKLNDELAFRLKVAKIYDGHGIV